MAVLTLRRIRRARGLAGRVVLITGGARDVGLETERPRRGQSVVAAQLAAFASGGNVRRRPASARR